MQNLSTFHRELIILYHCLLLILHQAQMRSDASQMPCFSKKSGAQPPNLLGAVPLDQGADRKSTFPDISLTFP